jgi:GTPase
MSISTFDSLIQYDNNLITPVKLREEIDDDNIEYKLRLDGKSVLDHNLRKKQLISQMNFRMDSGKYLTGKRIAHYILGVHDDGTFGNLTKEELDNTITIFEKLVENCNATILLCERKEIREHNLAYIIIVKTDSKKIKEINVAFVGPSQHGKTTTISNLVYNINDDGNGYSRKLVLKHEHEKKTGITSCIKKEIIGLKNGKIIDFSSCIESSSEEIVRTSDKIINLIDLPGNSRYYKTTLFGLSSYKLDAIIIILNIEKVVEHDNVIINFYKSLAKILNIPIRILLIKTDIMNFDCSGDNIVISNITREGYELLIKFFDHIEHVEHEHKISTKTIFNIVDIYDVPDTGLIFSGMMIYGNLSLKQKVFLTNGKEIIKTNIKSIHRKQVDSNTIYQNETGAIQLDLEKISYDKHMVITTDELVFHNTVKIKLLYNLSNINKIKNQIFLLFVGNNIIQVIPTVQDKNIIILKSLDKLIFFEQDNIVFLKHLNNLYIGEIY